MSIVYHTPLSAEAQRALGVDEPAPLAMADKVHHDDLDALLHVNNVTYLVWFERLRIRFMEHYGLGTIGDPNSPRIVIRSGHVHWVEELLRGADYVVTCRCIALRRTSFTVRQTIWSEGRLCTTFEAVIVLLKQDGSARLPIPEDIRAQLIAHGARDDVG